MDLSVVIPTIKDRSDIEAIKYLHRCAFKDYEVIVRDDVPVTKARNEGYKRASADKILFLDDDSKPRSRYLSQASKTLKTEAAVAGKTVHPQDDIFAGQLTEHYNFGDQPRYVDHFWGCNMGIRKGVLESVGGWDERMGWGHEEKELADRVRDQYDIYYNPEMIVDHVYAESIRDYWKKKYRLEKTTPYYLQKKGLSERQILSQTLKQAFNPRSYIRRSVPLTLATSGATVTGTIGRFVGLVQERSTTFEDKPARTNIWL